MSTLSQQPGLNGQSALHHVHGELQTANLTPKQKDFVLQCVNAHTIKQATVIDDMITMPPSAQLLEALRNLPPPVDGALKITSEIHPVSLLQGLLIDAQSLQEKPRADLFVLGISALIPTGEETMLAKAASPIFKPFVQEAEHILTRLRSGDIMLGKRLDIDGETKVHMLSLISTGENLSWVIKIVPYAETAQLIARYTNYLAEPIPQISPVHLFNNHHLLQEYSKGQTFHQLNTDPASQILAERMHKKLVEHAEYLLRYEPPTEKLTDGLSVWIDTAHWNFRFMKNEFEKIEAKWFDVVGVKTPGIERSSSSTEHLLGPDL